jgi:hypothetical protein
MIPAPVQQRLDQKIKLQIGELIVQNAALVSQIEDLQQQLSQAKEQLERLTPKTE